MKTDKYLNRKSIFLIVFSLAFLSCLKKENPLSAVVIKKEKPTNNEGNESLIYTPNESFFSPTGTLRANLRDKTSGNTYNKNEYYNYIYNWKILTDTIVFGINIKTAGDLIIKPEMAIPTEQDGSILNIYIDKDCKETKLKATNSEETYQIQNGAVFKNVSTGFHIIKLQLKSLATAGTGIGRLNNIHISGKAAKNSENVMRRYRAKAVHAKWQSESTNPIEISVHELTVTSKNQDYYQPITTPFGYTGSTWNKDTQTFGGYNFSLWSYGANDPVPPFYQESHLIATGPNLIFGSYGHEGTGVKPRGNHPYIGVDTNVQTIAVRQIPGKVYNTYWSYYLDPNDGHWKLYGCGKKYNKDGEIKSLVTGAFIEVPGPASKVRNGHRISETHYRGWQMDTSKNWYPINTMVGTTTKNGLSFRNWKIVDNKFAMQMGGWGEPDIEKKTLKLNNPSAIPHYLKGKYLNELYSMPATFSHNEPINITNNSVELSFNVTDLGTNAQAVLFWGTDEGLTKTEKWQNSKNITIGLGANTVKLDNLKQGSEFFYRIRVKNNEGTTWSLDTQKFKTKNI